MKNIIILIVMILTFDSWAGLPPTTTKGQNETTKATTFNFQVPRNQVTTISGPTRLIDTGHLNVIPDPGFEGPTTFWSTYADVAGASPVDGISGTPNITFANTSGTDIRAAKYGLLTKDAANRQGQGISFTYNADPGDFGHMVSFSFNYSSSVNYASGDIKVFMYDVTNGTLLTAPYNNSIIATARGYFWAQLPIPTSTSSLRIILHISTTNANAYTFKMDNVVLSGFTLNAEFAGMVYMSDSGQSADNAQTIEFEDVTYDTHNAYNTTTGVYTFPVAGRYSICVTLRTQAVVGAIGNAFQPRVVFNGVDYATMAGFTVEDTASIQRAANGTCTTVQANINDTARVDIGENVTGALNLTTLARDNRLEIQKLD